MSPPKEIEMTKDEKAAADLPPVGVFVPDETGLVSWTPRFDRITVRPAPRDGEVGLELSFHGEGTTFIKLPPGAARHLAEMIRAAADAVDGAGAGGCST